jgi:hypothetical protein
MTTPTLIEKLVLDFDHIPLGVPMSAIDDGVLGINVKNYLRTALLTIQKAERDAVREWVKEQIKGEDTIIDGLQDTWNQGHDRAINKILSHLSEQDNTQAQ